MTIYTSKKANPAGASNESIIWKIYEEVSSFKGPIANVMNSVEGTIDLAGKSSEKALKHVRSTLPQLRLDVTILLKAWRNAAEIGFDELERAGISLSVVESYKPTAQKLIERHKRALQLLKKIEAYAGRFEMAKLAIGQAAITRLSDVSAEIGAFLKPVSRVSFMAGFDIIIKLITAIETLCNEWGDGPLSYPQVSKISDAFLGFFIGLLLLALGILLTGTAAIVLVVVGVIFALAELITGNDYLVKGVRWFGDNLVELVVTSIDTICTKAQELTGNLERNIANLYGTPALH